LVVVVNMQVSQQASLTSEVEILTAAGWVGQLQSDCLKLPFTGHANNASAGLFALLRRQDGAEQRGSVCLPAEVE
jgi:hypothetical protein